MESEIPAFYILKILKFTKISIFESIKILKFRLYKFENLNSTILKFENSKFQN